MLLRPFALGVAVVAALLAIEPGVASATFPGSNGRLAFIQGHNPNCHYPGDYGPQCDIDAWLRTIDNDGHGLHTLTTCADPVNMPPGPPPFCLDGAPAYSPDGGRLAYASRGQIVVARADGSAPRILPAPPRVLARAVQWSPGGGRLVFLGQEEVDAPYLARAEAGADAYLMRADGSATRRLTHRGTVASIAWSSRGGIAFVTRSDSPPVYVHGHPTGSRIMRLNLRTGEIHQLALVPAGHDATNPDWSPDGRRLLFSGIAGVSTGQRVPTVQGLYVLNVGTRRVRRIYRVTQPHILGGGIWSPDGSRIAFVQDFLALMTMSSDGGRPHTLLQAPGDMNTDGITPPSWQPLPGVRKTQTTRAQSRHIT